MLTSPFATMSDLASTQVFVVSQAPEVLGPLQGIAAYVRGAVQTDASNAAGLFQMLAVQMDPRILVEADFNDLGLSPDAPESPATLLTAHWSRSSQTLHFESPQDQIALARSHCGLMVPVVADISLGEVASICSALREASTASLSLVFAVSLNAYAERRMHPGVGRIVVLCTGRAASQVVVTNDDKR